MPSAPKLSYVCPMPWAEMDGDDRSRFCEKCGHQVHNLSLLTAEERLALLNRAEDERICGSYLLRLSGELITPETPLLPRERGLVKQLGLAALSASALALAAGCVSSETNGRQGHSPAAETASAQPDLSPLTTTPSPSIDPKGDDVIILLSGIICAPAPPRMHGPHAQ